MERLLPFAVAALCVAVAVLVPTSAPDEQVVPEPTTSTTAPQAIPDAVLAVSSVVVHSAGPALDALPADVAAAVDRTLRDFLRSGSLVALATGRAGDGIASLFTTSTRAALQGADRAVLVDERLGDVTGVRLERADVALVALAGAAGEVGAVVATLDWHTSGRAPGGAVVTVSRSGEVTLVPDGDRWRIDAFQLAVDQARTVPVTTTTRDAGEDEE